MPLLQDVLGMGKQLEKLVEEEKAGSDSVSDMLKQLKELPITLDILQKTRIGMVVNVVRKASNRDDIQSVAKTLIKSWKKLLDGDKSKTKAAPATEPALATLMRTDSSSSNTSNTSEPAAKKPNNHVSSKNNIQFTSGDREVRGRCRDMIANSLKCADRPAYDPTDTAAEIENEIFLMFKDTNIKYKNRIKSRVMNLRDKRNPELRQLVIEGGITPEKFAKMTPEEMASDEMRDRRKKITEEAIRDHQMATTAGTSTGQFKCNRCGQRKTTYNQVQTRSADEPMTTFVYCLECGNRWKFC